MITFHAIGADGVPEKLPVRPEGPVLDICAATAVMARGQTYRKPWVGYIVTDRGQAVGSCAFKAAPKDGWVTVTYHTFPAFTGRGYATAMLRALIKIARHAEPGITVIAQTLPHESASTAILEKCGFAYIGMVNHPEDGLVWEWHLQ